MYRFYITLNVMICNGIQLFRCYNQSKLFISKVDKNANVKKLEMRFLFLQNLKNII